LDDVQRLLNELEKQMDTVTYTDSSETSQEIEDTGCEIIAAD